MAAVKPGRWIKASHGWIGLGSAAFVLALSATGMLLNRPGALPDAERTPYVVASDPARPERLYRGTRGALERSEDEGATWTEVPMLFPAEDVVGVSFDPKDPTRIYVLQRWLGPLASTDGGTVWEPMELPFDPQADAVELVSMAATGAGRLVLETSVGLWRFDGEAWTRVHARKDWTSIVRRMHSGHFFGEWGAKVYDVTSVALVFLIVTGVILWRRRTA